MRGARFLTFFSCVATIFAAPIPVRAARPGAHRQSSIPFIYEDARIYVPVRIEGGEPRWFVLDTGATGTIIDSAVARAAHLTTCGSESVYGAGNGASQQTWTRTVRLKVGGVPLRLTQPAVLDLAHLLGPTSGRAPAGIIGSQFFEEHFVAIDFEARRITVYPPAADRRALYSFAAPLTFADSTPLTHVELTLPEGRTVSANALVDLGAKSTFLIPEPFIDRDKLRTSLPKAVVTGFGAGVGGDTFYAFARASRLGVPGASWAAIDGPIVGLSVGGSLRSTWNEGLLGAEFLSRFRVGFDYRHRRLLLARGRSTPVQFDRSGLFIVAAGLSLRELVVRQVLKGGPGDAAGLSPGDEILAIDGKAAREIGLARLRERLKQSREGIVIVSYRRGADQRTARLQLRDLV